MRFNIRSLLQFALSSFTLYVDPPSGAAAALTGDGTPPPPVGDGTPPPPDTSWFKDFKDQGVKDWLTSYKDAYPNAEAIALKAQNLEKFVGVEKSGRGVIVPKTEAPQAEWTEFWKKVGGAPEKPDGYTMPKVDGVEAPMLEAVAKDPMVAKFREQAHAMGMPPQFFQSVMSWYIKEAAGKEAASYSDFEAQSKADVETMRSEWKGVEYDKNIELGRRAAQMFVPHANKEELQSTLNKIEGALGTAATMRLFAKIGTSLGEHVAVMGDGMGGTTGGLLSPEQARIRIDTLKKDTEWGNKFRAGGAEQKKEWDMLHTIAFGTK